MKHAVAIVHGRKFTTTICKCGATRKWYEPHYADLYRWQHEQLNQYETDPEYPHDV